MNEEDPIYAKKLQTRKQPKIEETEKKAVYPTSPNDDTTKITQAKTETSKNDDSKTEKQDDTN